MVNKRLIGIKRSLQTALAGAPLDRESYAGATHVVSAKVPEERLAGIVSRLAPLAVKEWRPAPLLSTAHAPIRTNSHRP
jgi:hypothetical protein